MAKQIGPVVFVGSLGNVSLYEMLGVGYARKKGGGSRETIRERDSCEPVRQNNMEFSGAVLVSRLVYAACDARMKIFGDRYTMARLNGQFKKVCQLGEGTKGSRVLSLYRHGHGLVGFEVNKPQPLGSVFALAGAVRVQRNADVLTVFLPAFGSKHIHALVGATHFRLTCMAIAVADYVYDGAHKVYAPGHVDGNGLGMEYNSTLYPVDANVSALEIDLDFGVLPVDMAVLVCLGISFFESDTMMKQGRAMRVVGAI